MGGSLGRFSEEMAPPTRMEKLAYDFDIWYTSDPMSEVYLLAGINAFFCMLLFFAFWFTGSLTDLSGLTWFSEMLWMSWGQLSGKAPKARDAPRHRGPVLRLSLHDYH